MSWDEVGHGPGMVGDSRNPGFSNSYGSNTGDAVHAGGEQACYNCGESGYAYILFIRCCPLDILAESNSTDTTRLTVLRPANSLVCAVHVAKKDIWRRTAPNLAPWCAIDAKRKVTCPGIVRFRSFARAAMETIMFETAPCL